MNQFNRPLIKAILDSPKASFQLDKYSRRELEFILNCVIDYYRKEHTMCMIYNKYCQDKIKH